MYCSKCQYDLRSNTSHECPECGRLFDPNDESSFLSSPISVRRRLWLGITAGVAIIAVANLFSWFTFGETLLWDGWDSFGFPFEIYGRGGYAGNSAFHPLAIVWNIAVGVGVGLGIGVATICWTRRHHA